MSFYHPLDIFSLCRKDNLKKTTFSYLLVFCAVWVITTLAGVNPHPLVREIQKILGMSHGSIVAHLRDADYVSRMNVWVPN